MRTPQEEAERIIEMYEEITFFEGHLTERAKYDCALIHVDGIMKETDMYKGNLNPRWKYWKQVNKIIEKQIINLSA